MHRFIVVFQCAATVCLHTEISSNVSDSGSSDEEKSSGDGGSNSDGTSNGDGSSSDDNESTNVDGEASCQQKVHLV